MVLEINHNLGTGINIGTGKIVDAGIRTII